MKKSNLAGILVIVGMLLCPIVMILLHAIFGREKSSIIIFGTAGVAMLMLFIFHRRLFYAMNPADKSQNTYNWVQKWFRALIGYQALTAFYSVADDLYELPHAVDNLRSMGYSVLLLLIPAVYLAEYRKLHKPVLRHEALAAAGIAVLGLSFVTSDLAWTYDVEGLPGYALCLGPLIISLGMLIAALILWLNWRERQQVQASSGTASEGEQ